MSKEIFHPLVDENSPHYEKNGEQTITKIEKDLTVIEMIGACKFNIAKYQERDKGQDEADERKIGHYKAYLELLEKIPKRLHNTIVRRAYKNLNWSVVTKR